jgi:hypothetical protein
MAHKIVPTAAVADSFLRLAERCHANFVELCETGRWTHYYSEAELHAHARDLDRLLELWAHIAERGRIGLPNLERALAASRSASSKDGHIRRRAA